MIANPVVQGGGEVGKWTEFTPAPKGSITHLDFVDDEIGIIIKCIIDSGSETAVMFAMMYFADLLLGGALTYCSPAHLTNLFSISDATTSGGGYDFYVDSDYIDIAKFYYMPMKRDIFI